MSLCDDCIYKKECMWRKSKTNMHHCTLYKDKYDTNFDRITASPKALAEFICDISFYFPWDDSEFCCRYNIETEQDRLNFVRDWLNEEYKNE